MGAVAGGGGGDGGVCIAGELRGGSGGGDRGGFGVVTVGITRLDQGLVELGLGLVLRRTSMLAWCIELDAGVQVRRDSWVMVVVEGRGGDNGRWQVESF